MSVENNNHEHKNPNRLEGHEGQLLKTISNLIAYEHQGNEGKADKSLNIYEYPAMQIPSGSIVMFVGHGAYKTSGENVSEWIDVLYKEKKLTIVIDLNQWLRYFIPWPHGAFIEQ